MTKVTIKTSRDKTVKVYGSRSELRVYLPSHLPEPIIKELTKDIEFAQNNDWTPSKIEHEINYFLQYRMR